MSLDSDHRWDRVAVVPGRVRADILKGRLETEGIPVKLKYEAAGTIYGLTLDGLGEVEILVPSRCIESARTILAQTYRDEDIPWDGHQQP